MNFTLTPEEARALGALVEKQVTTPDYYPLTLNALMNACNQKSNRDPVVDMSVDATQLAVDRLRQKQLIAQTYTEGSRAVKYAHRLGEAFALSPQELGTLCVLLLRGPQTAGELNTRCERHCGFSGLAQVEETLRGLMEREGEPLAARLPRRPGQKESRYAHLLCGTPAPAGSPTRPMAQPPAATIHGDARIGELERKVDALRAEVEGLKRRLDAPPAAR